MEKEKYINQEVLKLLQSRGSIILSAAAFLIGLLTLLAYSLPPENFFKFCRDRKFTSVVSHK